MEERSIKVTLKQAVEWYNSSDSTLRTLALSAYTKDELEFSYNSIESKVDQTCKCFNVPICEQKKFQALTKLAIIAKYYNKGWKKTLYNIGYTLGELNYTSSFMVERYNDIGVYQHIYYCYAGLVYFKNREDAINAIKILGDEAEELFK